MLCLMGGSLFAWEHWVIPEWELIWPHQIVFGVGAHHLRQTNSVMEGEVSSPGVAGNRSAV